MPSGPDKKGIVDETVNMRKKGVSQPTSLQEAVSNDPSYEGIFDKEGAHPLRPEDFGLEPGEESVLDRNLESLIGEVVEIELNDFDDIDNEDANLDLTDEQVLQKWREDKRMKMAMEQAEFERKALKEKSDRLREALYQEDYTGVYRELRVEKSILFEEVFQMPKGQEGIGLGGEMGPENEWGLRKVCLDGKFNFLKWTNMLLVSEVVSKWFDEATDFKMIPFGGNGPIPLALVRQKEKYYFLTTDGFLMPASGEEKEAFLKADGKIGLSEKKVAHTTSNVSDYVARLASRVEQLSCRFVYTPAEKEAANMLVGDLNRLGAHLAQYIAENAHFSLDSTKILTHVKKLLGESLVGRRVKAPLLKELLYAVEAMRVKGLFSPDLVQYKWDVVGLFDQGQIVKIGKSQFSLINNKDELIYPEDQFFNKISRFYGNVALVVRNDQYNFLLKENGNLVFSQEGWLEEAYGPNADLFRIKVKGRWNYLNYEGKLISEEWFEDAKDFDPKTGRASVKKGGRWVFIDREAQEILHHSDVRKVISIYNTDLTRRGLINPQLRNEIIHSKKNSLNYKLHKLFSGLIEKHHNQSYGLIRLFSKFREILNKNTPGKGVKPPSLKWVRIEMEKCLSYLEERSLLNLGNDRFDVTDFILSLYSPEIIWGEIRPLPVSLSKMLNDLINRSSVSQRGPLMRMVRTMEELVSHHPMDARENPSRFYRELDRILNEEAEIEPATKTNIREILMDMRHEKNAYWKKAEGDFFQQQKSPKEALNRKKTTEKIIRQSRWKIYTLVLLAVAGGAAYQWGEQAMKYYNNAQISRMLDKAREAEKKGDKEESKRVLDALGERGVSCLAEASETNSQESFFVLGKNYLILNQTEEANVCFKAILRGNASSPIQTSIVMAYHRAKQLGALKAMITELERETPQLDGEDSNQYSFMRMLILQRQSKF